MENDQSEIEEQVTNRYGVPKKHTLHFIESRWQFLFEFPGASKLLVTALPAAAGPIPDIKLVHGRSTSNWDEALLKLPQGSKVLGSDGQWRNPAQHISIMAFNC